MPQRGKIRKKRNIVHEESLNEPVTWLEDGSPYSPRFQDRYRPRSGALAQARHVFLAGCGLPDGWQGRERCTVLETGFGLGQNFLATWAAWEADTRRSTLLHFVAIEAYPVAAADMVRNLQAASHGADTTGIADATVARLGAVLAAAWTRLAPGIQHLRFSGGQVQLTLAVGDVLDMLGRLECTADAVYLDGFSPACNPQMWAADTLQAVALHCRHGTRLATYTVASAVRRQLQAVGFRVEKRAGLPPKRHNLAGVFDPPSPAEPWRTAKL